MPAPTIYLSVEDGFQTKGPEFYVTTRLIIDKLKKVSDLHLVCPKDYDQRKGTIAKAYRSISDTSIEQILGEHEPRGDLFIIYGDGTPENLGVEFGRNEYAFLRQLQINKNFKYFFNTPDAEEATLKDRLVGLSRQFSDTVAATFFYESKEQLEGLLGQYGFLVMKPIFGCASAGVRRITIPDQVNVIAHDDFIRANYVFQEPLKGPELRVIILDGQFIGSRQDTNYQPWIDRTLLKTTIGEPTEYQISIAKELAKMIGADLLGCDFMEGRIYELNGTGTGLAANDENGKQIFDHSDAFVEFVLKKAKVVHHG